jgi:hypothetical protein
MVAPVRTRSVRQVDGVRDEQFRSYVLRAQGRLLRTAAPLSSGGPRQAEDLVQTVREEQLAPLVE